jgi:putative ABC transport system permease protein
MWHACWLKGSMIKNFLLITLRGMMKNKLFVIINVFGMGIAIACCVVAFLAYEHDATFNRVHTNRSSIYRVSAMREFDGVVTRFGYASVPLGDIIDKTFQDVDGSARYIRSWSDLKRGDDLFSVNLNYTDPDFFQMFSWEFIKGNNAGLKDKTSVIISEVMAVRLFGSPDDAYGKTITQIHGVGEKEFKITGIFRDAPANSSFYRREGCAYTTFENYRDVHPGFREDDWRQECSLFIQVTDPSRVDAVRKQLQSYLGNHNHVRKDFQLRAFALDPFTSMADRDRAEGVQTHTWDAPPLSAIMGSIVMAILLLLIACFNLTNTAIAISSRRLKEIGIRKVMGSMRVQLIGQFIGETTFICFLAMMIGIGITDLLIEGWNIVTGNNIYLTSSYFSNPSVLVFLAVVLLFTGVVAGSYPAFYISKFQPVTILKGKLKFGGTNNFTRILLGLQFAFSLIAIVNAIGFFQNAQFQKNYDLGFDIRGSVTATLDDPRAFDTYRNALQENPGILSIAGARNGILSSPGHEPVRSGSQEVEVDIIEVGENYVHTMDLDIVHGRDFITDSETDRQASVLITQNMASLFGWDDALGKEIIWRDSVRLM